MLRQNCRRLSRFSRPVLTRWYHEQVAHPRRNSRNIELPRNGSAAFSSYFHHFKDNIHLFSAHPQSFPSTIHYPIDFNDLIVEDKEDKDLGVCTLVQLVQKAAEEPALRGEGDYESEAIKLLDGSNIQPHDKLVYFAIWELRDHWNLALLLFNWGAKSCCCTDEKLVSLIVWVLGSHKKFNIAWSLIRDSHQSSVKRISRQAMLVMIERYAAANSAEKSIKTFNMLEKLRASPDQNAFYILLCALCANGNVEEAEEIMLRSRKLFPLQAEVFNIILNGWCKIFVDVNEAKRIWREMSRCCITPNATSYTNMISCFSRVGNLFDSLRLFDEMKRNGWIPSLDVYNSLMYVLTREDCLKEALQLLEKLKAQGLRPNSASFDSLICPLCGAKKFDDARLVFKIMRQENVSPSISTYNALLEGATLESTLAILKQMKEDSIQPDHETFSVLLDKFFSAGHAENALKIWFEMRNYGVEPDCAHYVSLVQGLLDCGHLAKAREMYTEMTFSGIQDDPKLKRLLAQLERNSRCQTKPLRVESTPIVKSEQPPSTVRHVKREKLVLLKKKITRRKKKKN